MALSLRLSSSSSSSTSSVTILYSGSLTSSSSTASASEHSNIQTQCCRLLLTITGQNCASLLAQKMTLLHSALSCAVYCNHPCLFVSLFHDNSKLRASYLYQTGSVGEGSNHLQLNFGCPAPLERVSAAGPIFFGFALLQPAGSVCVSSECFVHCERDFPIR